MISRILFLFFLVFFSGIAEGQTTQVVGKVQDNEGNFVHGALIESLDGTVHVFSAEDGAFAIALIPNRDYILLFAYEGKNARVSINLSQGEILPLGNITVTPQHINEIVVKKRETDDFGIIQLAPLDFSRFAINGGVTKILAYTTAATSNNELTANYNVRGGNYDENLIYVNGFQIYRPFLVRAGQQEGMSFINSNMVESVSFSAGGFLSRYGDKLSSVLDIKYRDPDSLRISVVAGILGVEGNFETKMGNRFSIQTGARFRSNGYLLNTLPNKGEYNPVFWDIQFLTHYQITEKLRWNVLGHYSSNKYQFIPQDRNTTFGTFNQALSLKMYFDGKERSIFSTITGGTSFEWDVSKRTRLNFYASVFNTNESEKFDVNTEYFINQLENDPAKANYGDSVSTLGVGGFFRHARNQLNATIAAVYHTGRKDFIDHKKMKKDGELVSQNSTMWGIKYQQNYFNDVLSEYNMVDSAGYYIPTNPGGDLKAAELIRAHNVLSSGQSSAFAEHTFRWNFYKNNFIVKLKNVSRDSTNNKKIKTFFNDTISRSAAKLEFNLGGRVGYTSINKEGWFTPRMALTYIPRLYFYRNGKVYRRNVKFRLSTGLYYQPPLYRDLRTLEGQVNRSVLAQKSFHVVLGTDIFFNMWDRPSPFKFTAEAYYKYMWDVNPYFINDVRLRYLAKNDAVAFAYGLDLSLHGQFIKGIESYFKIGLLNTKINLLDDNYYLYLNKAGDTIYPGYTFDTKATDSILVKPGYIPRPSSQIFTFGMLFQDRMPKFERMSAQLSMLFGTGLPYGPPGYDRYKAILRQKAYMRIDLGIGYDFLYNKPKEKRKKFFKGFDDIRLSFEVFNLLGNKNVLSQTWVQDVNGRFYAVPNYLTLRRFNLKLIFRI
jgi:hypothetical protein